VRTLRSSLPVAGGRRFEIYNHNKLLPTYRGTIGVKTGYTVAAGRTIVAAERRAGRTLIAVALGTPSLRTEQADVRSMFAYGFATRPPSGGEILGGAATARRGPSSAKSTAAADLAAKGGPAPVAPAAVVHTGLASRLRARLLAAPVAVAVAGGTLLVVLGMLAVTVLRPRGGRVPAAGPHGDRAP
jgi:D-alanyl-D-alanine carboxypeptidase